MFCLVHQKWIYNYSFSVSPQTKGCLFVCFSVIDKKLIRLRMISKPVYYLLYSCGAYTYSYEGRETPGIFLQLKLAKLLKLILQRQDGLKY